MVIASYQVQMANMHILLYIQALWNSESEFLSDSINTYPVNIYIFYSFNHQQLNTHITSLPLSDTLQVYRMVIQLFNNFQLSASHLWQTIKAYRAIYKFYLRFKICGVPLSESITVYPAHTHPLECVWEPGTTQTRGVAAWALMHILI